MEATLVECVSEQPMHLCDRLGLSFGDFVLVWLGWFCDRGAGGCIILGWLLLSYSNFLTLLG